MKKLTTILMGVAAATAILSAGGNLAPVAQVKEAESPVAGLYFGGGIGNTWTYDKGDFDFSNDKAGKSYVDAISGLQVGYEFAKYGNFSFAAEGRLLSSFDSNDFDTTVYSAYLRPEYNFEGYPIGIYGLIGASHVRYNVGPANDSQNAFSFGLGAEYKITKHVSISADWTSNLWNKDTVGNKNTNNDVAMVWVSYKF